MDKNTGNSKVRISAICSPSASCTASGLHNEMDLRLYLTQTRAYLTSTLLVIFLAWIVCHACTWVL